MCRARGRYAAMVMGLAVAAAAVTIAAARPQAPLTPGYGLRVDITRDLQAATYQLTAVVTDLQTGRDVTAPRIAGELGREAESQTTLGQGADQVKITLNVMVDEHIARYELLVTRGDEVLSRQSATLTEKIL